MKRMPAMHQQHLEDAYPAGEKHLTSLLKTFLVNMYKQTIIPILLLACVLAAGCVSSDVPEDDPPRWVDEEIMPTPTPAPMPIRTPVPPVEAVAPEPTPTPTPAPTPQNTTSTLCDYPPCGRGGGGGSGSTGGGGSLPDDPICELPTVLLVLAGLGLVAICAGRRR